MKKHLLSFMTSFLVLSLGLCTLLQGQTGIVRGTLIEDETGFPLIGANVLVKGLDGVGTITDLDGKFSIEELDPGEYALELSYISFQTIQLDSIVVKSGEVTVIGEVHMQEASEQLQEVVVVARELRNTETAMQTLQRKSINTLDAISNQAFSLTGDGDAAAAVKRVPGVSVEGGKFVYVRGLGDRYSKTTLNGSNIPGLDPNRNTVQMDLFPTNLIENIVVYKNFTPDLPGDFTGGLVNVSTRDFPDDMTFKASLSTGFNTNATFNDNFLTYEGSPTDWLGFDNGTREVNPNYINLPPAPPIATAPASEKELVTSSTLEIANELEPTMQAAPVNYSGSIAFGNRSTLFNKPFGYIGSLTYNRSFSGYDDGFAGRYKLLQGGGNINEEEALQDAQFVDEVLVGLMINGSLKLSDNNKISLNLLRNQTGVSSARFQDGTIQGASFDYFIARTLYYEERELNNIQLRGEHVFGSENQWAVDWRSSYTISGMERPNIRYINNFQDSEENPTIFRIDAAEDIAPTHFWREMDETTTDNNLDISYKYNQWSGRPAKLKFGGGYNFKDRDYSEQRFEYENGNAGNVEDWSNFVTPENVYSAENEGGVSIINRSEGRNVYNAQMTIPAAYLMTELPLTERFKTILGARWEGTEIVFSNESTVNPITDQTYQENDILPSLALIYELVEDKMNLRGSYSRTLARPTFREISPVALYDFELRAFILGNPDLQRTLIDNIDLRWEYFFNPGELISISIFYKDFTNPIELTINEEAQNLELQYRNVEQARVFGFELEARKNLGFLSPDLNGLSIGTNLTLLESQVDIPQAELDVIRSFDPDAEDTRPLFAQAPYLINAYLQYLSEGRKTRANLSFNVQGERLFLVSRGGTPNVFEQPFPLLNFKISQQVTPHWTLSLRAQNILNPEFQRTQEYRGEEFFFRQFQRGQIFTVGLSYQALGGR